MAAVPYLTADEVRARQPAVDADDGTIEGLVAEFEDLAERYRGVAFTPREATAVCRAVRGVVELPDVMIREITTITAAGASVTWDDDDLDEARGRLGLSRSDKLTIAYEHGLDAPPEGLLAACAAFVRRRVKLDASGTSRDVLSQNFDGGTTRYSTPSWEDGRPTGFLDIDAALNAVRDYRIGA